MSLTDNDVKLISEMVMKAAHDAGNVLARATMQLEHRLDSMEERVTTRLTYFIEDLVSQSHRVLPPDNLPV